MRSWTHRVVALALSAVVAGVPALVAACAVACAPDTAHRHATAAVEAKAPSCGHPGGLPDERDRVAQESQPGDAPARALTAAARGCCGADAVLSASLAAGRGEAYAWTAASTAAIGTGLRSLAAAHTEPIVSLPVSPPSPTRAPLVLRV